MQAVVPNGCRHARLRIATTRPTEFVDLTDRLKTLVAGWSVQSGMVNVQTLHTTAAIVVNENEPFLLGDFQVMLEIIAPSNLPYRHDDLTVRTVNVVAGERVNGHAHCRGLLLGASACLNVADGVLQLGEWQRVFLVELDGPRERQLSVVVVGESGR